MSESPQEVKERIHAEELAKGSDPRVAEGRAKAAEARATHGLPLDPQEAWKVKLSKAGGAPAAAPATPPEPAPEPDVEPPAPEPQTAETPADEDEEGRAAPDQPPAIQAEGTRAAPPQAAPAAAVLTPPVEEQWDPDVGDVVEVFDEPLVTTVAGVTVVDSRIPTRLMLVLLIIPMWAILYLLAASSGDPVRASTGCVVSADHSFVCFQPRHEEQGGGGGH